MAPSVFYTITGVWILISIITFFTLLKIPVPYGRHIRPGWGPSVSARIGWFIMELPAAGSLLLFYITGESEKNFVLTLFLVLWEIHYINRAFIFPFRIQGDRKQMILTVVLMAFCFNIMNGFLNGFYLFSLAEKYDLSWLIDARFIGGALLFFSGFTINQISDGILRNLRRKNDDRKNYSIPKGFLFERVSCPNYFGEILEWFGWALLTWSFPALAFSIWTAANLIPRGIVHHRWYNTHFPSYPQNRNAIIPFVL